MIRKNKATIVNNTNQNTVLLSWKMGNHVLYYYYYFSENNMVQDLRQWSGGNNPS